MADQEDDIVRYLSGRMPAAEMHALEKKALDDPFLADALAGGESMSADEFAADVAALHDRIGQRVVGHTTEALNAPIGAGTEGREVTFWSWPLRIAAGLLLLACASAIFYFIQDDVRDDNLALAEKSRDEAQQESITADAPSAGAAAADSVNGNPGSISSIQKNEASSTTQGLRSAESEPAKKADPARQAISAPPAAAPQSQDADPATEDVGEVVAAERPLALQNEQEDATKDADAAPASAVSPAEGYVSKRAAGEEKSRRESKNIFTGKVVDDDGTGIPGVNVIVKGTNVGTVTDINGDYQLALDETNPTLVYTFIGYANTEQVADVAKRASVTLDEDVAQLSEVVVVGYGAQREADPLESTYEFANPVGGKRQFKQYLEKNLQYPQQALLNNVEGRVTVQFAVETTGSLVDFKVLKGLGSGCDEEVIRLIKSGPKWSPTKRDDVAQRSLIKVRMKFQLPKKRK